MNCCFIPIPAFTVCITGVTTLFYIHIGGDSSPLLFSLSSEQAIIMSVCKTSRQREILSQLNVDHMHHKRVEEKSREIRRQMDNKLASVWDKKVPYCTRDVIAVHFALEYVICRFFFHLRVYQAFDYYHLSLQQPP